jgi:hypothetical protein
VSWISSWRLKSVVVGGPSQGTPSSFSSTLLRVLMLRCVQYSIELFVGIIVAAALMICCFHDGAAAAPSGAAAHSGDAAPSIFRSVASPAILVRAFVGVIVAAALTMFCFPRWSCLCGRYSLELSLRTLLPGAAAPSIRRSVASPAILGRFFPLAEVSFGAFRIRTSFVGAAAASSFAPTKPALIIH